jgi:hypothetical protein
MFRITPHLLKIKKYNFSYYNTIFYYNKKQYDFTHQWFNMNITSNNIFINNKKMNKIFSKNLINYINLPKEKQESCYHFARYLINNDKYYMRIIDILQLESLEIFDRIGLFSNDMIREHECIYIGKYYEQYIFLSKLGSIGIYFTNIYELLKLYKSYHDMIYIYRVNKLENLVLYNDDKHLMNIKKI